MDNTIFIDIFFINLCRNHKVQSAVYLKGLLKESKHLCFFFFCLLSWFRLDIILHTGQHFLTHIAESITTFLFLRWKFLQGLNNLFSLQYRLRFWFLRVNCLFLAREPFFCLREEVLHVIQRILSWDLRVWVSVVPSFAVIHYFRFSTFWSCAYVVKLLILVSCFSGSLTLFMPFTRWTVLAKAFGITVWLNRIDSYM